MGVGSEGRDGEVARRDDRLLPVVRSPFPLHSSYLCSLSVDSGFGVGCCRMSKDLHFSVQSFKMYKEIEWSPPFLFLHMLFHSVVRFFFPSACCLVFEHGLTLSPFVLADHHRALTSSHLLDLAYLRLTVSPALLWNSSTDQVCCRTSSLERRSSSSPTLRSRGRPRGVRSSSSTLSPSPFHSARFD